MLKKGGIEIDNFFFFLNNLKLKCLKTKIRVKINQQSKERVLEKKSENKIYNPSTGKRELKQGQLFNLPMFYWVI